METTCTGGLLLRRESKPVPDRHLAVSSAVPSSSVLHSVRCCTNCRREFREPSWYDERVFACLERHRVALCLHDMAGSASGRSSIGPFVYVRFHGTSKYIGSHSTAALEEWGRPGGQARRGGQ